MPPIKNRRKNLSIMGIKFDVPLTWLIGVIVLGLVKFGSDYHAFEEIKEGQQKLVVTSKIIENKISELDGTNMAIKAEQEQVKERLRRLELFLDGHRR